MGFRDGRAQLPCASLGRIHARVTTHSDSKMKRPTGTNPSAPPATTEPLTDLLAEPLNGEVSSEADMRLRYRLIYDQLKNAIALGKIAPGLVLLEGPVARIFGTSRAP